MVMIRLLMAAMLGLGAAGGAWAAELKLLHASYLSTRGLYEELNRAFAADHFARTGQAVQVEMSHAASDHQVAYISDGSLEADVVSLPNSADIDEIVGRSGKIVREWRMQHANQSSPFATAIALLVRAGNPLGISDWDDIIAHSAQMIASDPQTSSFARYRYFVTYVHAFMQCQAEQQCIMAYLADLDRRITVMAPTVAESKATFYTGLGDVLPVWESEAMTFLDAGGSSDYELVYPDVNVLCQPRIAAVSGNTVRHGTEAAVKAYINFVYSEAGQEIIARHGLRPYRPSVWKRHRERFRRLNLTDMSQHGNIAEFRRSHFEPGGLYHEHVRLREPHGD